MPILPFDSDRNVQTALPQIVTHLSKHGIIAYPTETVYGLGGGIDATSVEALLRCKGRPPTKPFLMLISTLEMLDLLGVHLTPSAERLASHFWPGALTLVLPYDAHTGRSIPAALRGPDGGLAVRWTSHPALQSLLTDYGAPLTSTSANQPGEPPAMSAEEVERSYGSAIEREDILLLDGGSLPPSPPSTVIDCIRETPRVVRSGAISIDVLRTLVPDLISHS
jgi:L-threonylcarbamoyladenylate synthase